MNQKQQPNADSSKQTAPATAILSFLGLLNQISTSTTVSEFCTPGHKSGRAFEAMLAQPAALETLTFLRGGR